MRKPNLLISFSGGETSHYMTRIILEKMRDQFSDIIITFANTGEEYEETLNFVDRSDADFQRDFGIGVTWLEARVIPEKGEGTRHSIVSFETASRSGEPFEAMCAKYGIPNMRYKHCNRELKLAPIQSYAKSLGWRKYKTAIGIRADEIDRMSESAEEFGIIYPLIKPFPTTKVKISQWFENRPFRLDLPQYKGNCKTCWKKSDRKLYTIADDGFEPFSTFDRLEKLYGHVGYEFGRAERERDYILADDYRRVFFRRERSARDIYAEYKALNGKFERAHDEARVYQLELDMSGGCEESCEVFSPEDMEDMDYAKD